MKSRNPMIFVPLLAAAAVIVYAFCVKPGADRLSKGQKELETLRRDALKRSLEVRSEADIRRRIETVKKELSDHGSHELVPLLESYAMRAKAIVGEFASEAGIVDAEFTDRPILMLPVLPGKAVPPTLHARRPVAISCIADYAAIASFILRVERDLPYVTVSALRISPDTSNPEFHRAEIVLEWPSKGGVK